MEKRGGTVSPFAPGTPGAGLDQALIGASVLFRQVLHVIDTVAVTDCVVLLEGESGTGKELLARRIHFISPRNSGPFIPVNCPGISETLFESQFYGHVRGAFTGAATDTLGGNANLQLDGAIYLPSAPTTLTGNGGTLGTQLIVNTAKISGNGNVKINFANGTKPQIPSRPALVQ